MDFPSAVSPEIIDLTRPYFTDQLITYLGNKRSLLPFINEGIVRVKKKLGKDKIIALDGFSGSGVVSRLLKYHSSCLYTNDLEDYCEVLSKCYLANASEVDYSYIRNNLEWLNQSRLNQTPNAPGFIERNYAPQDDDHIQPGERVFYTNANAKIIDRLQSLIHTKIDAQARCFFLAPLIVKASIHTNTSGVFKGFHKRDGVGCFGGRAENALSRIKKEIFLDCPILSETEGEVHIFKKDMNQLVRSEDLPDEIDLAYYDPPYNQHPYGSNYFMLNIIANESPAFKIQEGVSGITKSWNRSCYNKTRQAEAAFDSLIAHTRAKYILISYNDEGIIGIKSLRSLLEKYGSVELLTQEYHAYRGSRNLRGRKLTVQECLWVLKKK